MPTSARPQKIRTVERCRHRPLQTFFYNILGIYGRTMFAPTDWFMFVIASGVVLALFTGGETPPLQTFSYYILCNTRADAYISPYELVCVRFYITALFLRYLRAAKRRPYTLFHDTYISIRPQQRTPKLSTLNSQRFIALIR